MTLFLLGCVMGTASTWMFTRWNSRRRNRQLQGQLNETLLFRGLGPGAHPD